MRSCIAPRAGLDGAYLALQMDRSALGSALSHELGFLPQGFPAGNFQQEWGETEMLLEGFFQVHAGQTLTCGHKRVLLPSLLLKRLRLENQMRNKGIKDLKNSSFLSTVEVLFSFNLCTINSVKSGFGCTSLILMQSFHFIEIHGRKYSLLT